MAANRIRHSIPVKTRRIIVLLDTSFLMKIFEKPLKTFDRIEQILGKTQFILISEVLEELRVLASTTSGRRQKIVLQALKYAEGLPSIEHTCDAPTVDRKIFDFALNENAIVATVDMKLKRELRSAGITVITCRGNEVVIEGMIPLK